MANDPLTRYVTFRRGFYALDFHGCEQFELVLAL